MKKYICILLPFMLLSCSKEAYNFKEQLPRTIITYPEESVEKNTVIFKGAINDDYGAWVTTWGFYYATSPEQLSEPGQRKIVHTTQGIGRGDYTLKATDLSPATTYYYQAFATNAQGTAVGEIRQFTTEKPSLPVLTTATPEVGAYGVLLKGILSDTGGYPIETYGFYYSTTQESPTSEDHTLSVAGSSATDTLSLTLANFRAETTYYVRAFAQTRFGKALANVVQFRTLPISLPQGATLLPPSQITKTTARLTATLGHTGGTDTFEAGFLYSDSQREPTLDNGAIRVEGQHTEGDIIYDLSALTPATTYYVRTFVTNSKGTTYGNIIPFQTLPTAPPTGVRFLSYQERTLTSVRLLATVEASQGGSLTEKGFLYSVHTNNPVEGNGTKIIVSGEELGNFSILLTGLTQGTNYFVRAYAKNEFGITYSEVVPFTTIAVELPSQLRISYVSSSATTFEIRGTVGNDGAGVISRRGFVYSKTNPQPTLADAYVEAGTGVGTFTATIYSLIIGTRYYVRAFATNERGTAYSNTEILTTATVTLPTLTIGEITEISSSSAKFAGQLLLNGGGALTRYGFLWSTSQANPVLGGADTQLVGFSENIIGSFSHKVEGLERNTTYYVRAFATNIAGTAYSEVKTFRTASLSIGDRHQGGRVAYLLREGDPGYVAGASHGLLIPLEEDLPQDALQWGCVGTLLGQTRGGLAEGQQNTRLLSSSCALAGSIGAYIQQYNAGGHSDWYIPSIAELLAIYEHKSLLHLPNEAFWTSSEKDHWQSYGISFARGRLQSFSKNEAKKLLPIRTF